MRELLLVTAAFFTVVGLFLVAIPLGLIALGIAMGAIAWFSE